MAIVTEVMFDQDVELRENVPVPEVDDKLIVVVPVTLAAASAVLGLDGYNT